MSTPAGKRRRIDAAAQTLSKPFRSPLKSVLSTTTSGDLPLKNLQDLDHILHTTDRIKGVSSPLAPPVQNMWTSFRGNPIKKSFSLSPSLIMNSDPDIAVLLKSQRQLEKQMRELKEELETSEQARKIEADSEKICPGRETDAELKDLIAKWRAASRHVAEELFTGVRDRVNRMGGPKAWKEMQQRQKEFQKGWDAEPQQEPDSDEGEDDWKCAEKRDLYAEYDVDAETANEKDAREGNFPLEDEGAEDEFTMSLMLRALNIPLSTIGYDREQERWSD